MINREYIQKELVQKALQSRNENGQMRCTIEAITGIGKTFISLFLIKELKPKSVLFLAETTMREHSIMEDIVKFNELFNYDILANHKITFMCYQSAYKRAGMYHDFVVADEIHDSLTPKYFQYYENNNYTHLLGLSATIDKKTEYIGDNGENYTKHQLLNKVAPIIATYSLKQGQEDRTSRKLNIIIIEHDLDRTDGKIAVEYKTKDGATKTFFRSELDYYNYCHNRFIQSRYSSVKSEFIIRYWMNKRNTFLYNLPSKTNAVIKLLTKLDLERTIVFGNSLDELVKICPTVSSKNTAVVNKQLIQDFNDGKLNTIGSFKMLKQGMNLKNLNNVILHSYYSIDKDFIQRVGRLRNAEEEGTVFIFMTKNTQEEVWINKIMNSVDLIYSKVPLSVLIE